MQIYQILHTSQSNGSRSFTCYLEWVIQTISAFSKKKEVATERLPRGTVSPSVNMIINLFSAEIFARFFKNKGFWCCKINVKTWEIVAKGILFFTTKPWWKYFDTFSLSDKPQKFNSDLGTYAIFPKLPRWKKPTWSL